MIRPRRRKALQGSLTLSAVALLVLSVAAGVALGTGLLGGDTFRDDDGNVHEANIEAIASAGVTTGCDPSDSRLFCPEGLVTRGQMAAFLQRALALPAGDQDAFADDDGTQFESEINALAAAGITQGCNPPDNDRFCPSDSLTRAQAAALIVRGFGYVNNAGGDLFTDDDGSVLEPEIDRLAAAGVTVGCNPPANTRFCPDQAVRRDQMASFLARALGFEPVTTIPGPPDTTTSAPTTSSSTTTPAADPVMIGAGDIANSNEFDSQTAAIIAGYPDATVFTTGDHAYPDGTAEEFATHYEPTWGAFKDRTRPSVGNHDDHIAGAGPYFDYFGANAGTPGEGWYSYDLANWHIIVLNSECGDDGFASCDEQSAWLEADLEANGQACMLAYWHKPVFNSGRHQDGYGSFEDEWEILDAAGVDVVVNGHDHNYQRYAPQDAFGAATPDGMRQFVAGSGGAGVYEQEISLPNLEEFYEGHGVLKLDLREDGYDWLFIPTEGTYTDSGSGTCDGG